MPISLRSKLALAFTVASLCLLGMVYALTQRGFDRDFLEFVGKQQLRNASEVEQRLVDLYQQENAWPPAHSEILRRAIAGDVMGREHERRRTRRLLLLDAEQRLLLGPKRNPNNLVTQAITVNNQTIGYLAIPRIQAIPAGLEQLFAAQQKRSFAITAAFASVAAFGFAWWFSGYFTAPIRALSRNINLLNQGERDVTPPTTNTRELKSLATDIAQLAATLKEHEQAQQQWLADIAHELRTPLTVLQGEAEALQDGIRPLDQRAVSSLLEEINHLHFLVNDLNDLAQADINAMVLNVQACNLVEAIDAAIQRHASALQARGHGMELAIDNKEFNLLADPQRLAQILDNLLSNCIRYCQSEANIRFSAKLAGDTIEWCIEDSGPGFSGNFERLFERLYRADSSRQRVSGGAGLGLAIVRSLVLAHGGQVHADASPLGGLKVAFSWPVAKVSL